MNTRVVLVTGAGGPLGVNFVRCLRMGALSLRIVGTDANRWHLPLSLCDETYRVPLARDRDAYAAAMRWIVSRERVDAIIPTHPVEVRAMAELRDEEAWRVGVALPASDVLATCDDKAATQSLLQRAGIPVPATLLLRGPDDVERAFAAFGGEAPVWVRGSGAPGLGIGGAALPCRDAGVAKAWIEHHRGWGKMAASEFLPGANLTWMALFDRGALIAAAARERLEYVLPHVAPSGITGAPAVSRTVTREDLSRTGEDAVRAVSSRPHGVFFVDFKESAEGVAKVTEINAGRCGTTVHFYAAAGFNFPLELTRLALGDAVDALAEPNAAIRPGQYWVRTLDCGPVLVESEAEFERFPSTP